MKRYKKLLMVAPLACMLGTGIFTLPNVSHAAEVVDAYNQGTTYSKENMEKALYLRLLEGIERSPELRQKFKMNQDEKIQREYFPENDPLVGGIAGTIGGAIGGAIGGVALASRVDYGLKSQLNQVNITSVGTDFKVTPSKVVEEDQGVINLLSYRNNTPEKQKAFTTEESYKKVDTVTATNQYGFKLSAKSVTKFGFDIGLAKGEQTFEVSAEFAFNRTDTFTTTNEKNVTFKAQEVIAAPGGTTDYFSRVKKAKFSGSFQTDAALDSLKVKLPIVKGGNMNVTHTEEVTLNSEDLYNIFKLTSKDFPLPSYLSFDDTNKSILVKNATFNYTGEIGYHTAIDAKFTPFDQTKATAVMPYAKYAEKTQANALLR